MAAAAEVVPRAGSAADPGLAPGVRWSPLELLPAVLVAVLGIVLLAPGHGLWFDELFTAEVGRLPLGEILTAIATGQGTSSYLADVPPSYNAPYYLVVHLWNSVPGLGGDTSLRVLSLLATAGGLALVTRAGARLAGRGTGVLAGLVLAANPLVLEQSVEARSYGLAVLATGATALGLVRWLQEAPRGLLLFGLAGAGMGLAHWYAVTVLAAFVTAAVVLRRRRALPVVLAGALAALPPVGFVVLAVLNGTGARNAEHLRDTDGALLGMAAEAWAGGRTPLLHVTLVLAVVGAVRARGARVVATSWVVVPPLLLLAAELVRPVFLPRYLLAGLLGLGVLAAAGAMAFPRAARAPVAALLLGCSLLAASPLAERPPRERAEEVVALLSELHEPGEPIVAADQRSAIGLDHYIRTSAPELRRDVVLPPDDAPADADQVWLVRRIVRGEPVPTDDDAILRDAGLRMVEQHEFPADKTFLVLQRWSR
ncbi:glycosyltransferase family 39 protein [Blastococcus xanthinilyticus]|uniref:Dolichyl-phosphate-mannose-protein mannosyltransferase n=1 Tax=Blastococcus xanthinilyticus TaxID=1564164 RepID=A0A5S5D449_9ACTN|nr:glycosyltransferase family 39 protein [Blastococcus xanthinilyticus]TYP90730.1 dolichyl-phosphate-mannose-protein mannosyltransferase [Blastococcus xanthinilyticus]